MLRDVLGHRIRKHCYFEFVNEMEKYYIYKDNVYQIIRMSKHYKLDGGWYVDVFVRNAYTGKRSNYLMPLKNFRERTLFKNKPKINKDNTSLNFINEKFDVTDKISQTCFESEYDFKKFSNKIISFFSLLKRRGYKNISLNFSDGYYVEYGETYSTLKFEFSYDRLKKQ
jgi:hypothetical protein